MLATRHIIPEKTYIIPTKNLFANNKNLKKSTSEYSLKQIFFDPTKNSPPNDFLNKLQLRMSVYNTSYVDKKDDSLNKE